MVKSSLPRVGKKQITDTRVLQLLQGVFEDKHIVHVVACKGTERAIAPPKGLTAEEAPFRRAIVEGRGTQEILMEDQWEDWTHLSNRQLTRPVRASHVNITVFAANPRGDTSETSSVEPIGHQSQIDRLRMRHHLQKFQQKAKPISLLKKQLPKSDMTLGP